MVMDAITARSRTSLGRGVWTALGLALVATAAQAQPVREALHGARLVAPRWSTTSLAPKRFETGIGPAEAGQFASIELSGTPGQRPRHSLRFRFDSATDTMRDWGVPVSECATLLRSSRHRSPSASSGDASRSLKVSLALSCRFF